MGTIVGNILRGAKKVIVGVAAGAGTILSLIPGVGGLLGGVLGGVATIGKKVGETIDRVSNAVNTAVESGEIPTTTTQPGVASTGSGVIATIPSWLIWLAGGGLLLLLFKKRR